MLTHEERAGMELVFHEAAHGVVAAVLKTKVHSLTTGVDSGRLHYTMFCDEDLPVGSAYISDLQFRLITKDCTVGLAGINAVMRFSQVSFWEGVQRGGWSDYFGVNDLASLLRPEIRSFMINQANEWAEAIVEAEWGIIGMVAKILADENTAQETYILDLLNKFGTQWELAPWNDAHWNEYVGSCECEEDEEDDDGDRELLDGHLTVR